LSSTSAPSPPSWRELALALLVALAAFAWPLRDGLFHPSRILLGVDTACAQLPWSAAPGGSDAVSNPDLADQGMVFYPAYRFALREWGSNGPPLWNPLIYAGAPAIGNPQLGLLDPQILAQVVVGRLFGVEAFDASFAWLVWLRLALSAVGAFALARRLGLGVQASSLAAIGFSSAGFIALWANHSLGHVAPFLPWVLFAIEGLRGPKPARSFVAAAALFALAIYGGHPETAFNLGLAAGLWSLGSWRSERHVALLGLSALALGTLLAAPCLVPFLEYLENSGALIARRALPRAGEPDWLALGACVLGVGIVWRWRELTAARERPPGIAASIGLGLLLAVCAGLLLSRSGLASARLFLWPDALGSGGTYRGSGQFLEQASAWIAAPIAVLALASVLRPSRADDRGMRRRATCMALGILALLLALCAPGVREVYAHLPLIGLAATVRFALVSALCLSLLAADALERAPRSARIAAVTCFAVLALLALRHTSLEGLEDGSRTRDPNDGVVEFTQRPARDIQGTAQLSGWIDPGLAVFGADLLVESVPASADGPPAQVVPVELSRATSKSEVEAPAGATFFRSSCLWLQHLPEGHWRFTLRLQDEHGGLLGTRIASTSTLQRPLVPTLQTIVFWSLAALFVLGLSPGVASWCLIVFAALQGLLFLEGIHPAISRERVFPSTATEEILARELRTRRYFAEPGVLPANTGMVRGLRALDGYDGLDPASFDGYRSAVLRPGVQALLGFSARNAEFGSAAFRLLGVGALALSAPIEAPDFELIASPEPDAPQRAECWIYRAKSPLPRAFCVSNSVSRETALADLVHFDPLNSVFLEDGAVFETSHAFQRSEVREIAWRNDEIELEVTLDGDGLCLLTEQHFPGWQVLVDGVEKPLLRADSIFRAVALEKGSHKLLFRYAPASWTLGLWLAALGCFATCAGAWLVTLRGAPRP